MCGRICPSASNRISLSFIAPRTEEHDEVGDTNSGRKDERRCVLQVCQFDDEGSDDVRGDDHDNSGRDFPFQMLRLKMSDLVGHDAIHFTAAEIFEQ